MKNLSVKQWLTVIFSVMLVFIAGIIGLATRLSYTENIQKLPENSDTVVMFSVSSIPEKNFELLWDADIIVKATAKEQGIIAMGGIKTKLKVSEVIKGDLRPTDDFILWQNSSFEYAGLSLNIPTIRAYEMSNTILPNREYLIFANHKPDSHVFSEYARKFSLPPEYISPTRPLRTYEDVMNSTACYYFMLEKTKVGLVSQGEDNIFTQYSAVKDCEILCQSMEIANEYELLKEKVLNRIAKSDAFIPQRSVRQNENA